LELYNILIDLGGVDRGEPFQLAAAGIFISLLKV